MSIIKGYRYALMAPQSTFPLISAKQQNCHAMKWTPYVRYELDRRTYIKLVIK